MSEHHDPVLDALRQLRGEVRGAVTPPPAAGLRARAVRQLRVRRATAVAVAAAVVAVIALSGATLLGSNAAPPPPPAGSPSMSPSPDTSPSPSSSPSPSPSPSTPPAPFEDVDWVIATIDVPPRDRPGFCPEGPVAFGPFSEGPPGAAIGPQDEFPAMIFVAAGVAYGDLTGDGRAEAVFEAVCAASEEGLYSGHGGQPLVVAGGEDGTLTGMGWVGPSDGAAFWDWWVEDGQLLLDADPWTGGYEIEPLPGLALAYEWDGDGFTGGVPAEAYPPILPLDPDQPGPPVRPGPVATELGCPDEEFRFTRVDSAGGTATAGGATWTLPSPSGPQQNLFDLNGTGDRLLVTALECEPPDGSAEPGLAVFMRDGDGWQGVALVPPPVPGDPPSYWSGSGGRFQIGWQSAANATGYRWNGTEFIEE